VKKIRKERGFITGAHKTELEEERKKGRKEGVGLRVGKRSFYYE